MRIIYFVDSSDSVNWGGQATSAGMRYLIEQAYPHAGFTPKKFGKLPLQSLPFFRKITDLMIYACIKHGKTSKLKSILNWYGVDRGIYDEFDVVCFNGEGAIHEKSGHFFRLIGVLHAFKMSGKRVYSLNQTIDVTPKSLHTRLLKLVYPGLDRVAVREPVSLRVLANLGLDCDLIGDAAYALPRIPKSDRVAMVVPFGIQEPFIAVTASSALKRDRHSILMMDRIIKTLSGLGRRIVFLANTKTDLYLATKLAAYHDFQTIDYASAKYREAIAIISMADLVVGGRQHPNIFAAKYGVPFIGLEGNTHKMQGVIELLNYPVSTFSWDFKEEELLKTAKSILNGHIDFSVVRVPLVNNIDLGMNE